MLLHQKDSFPQKNTQNLSLPQQFTIKALGRGKKKKLIENRKIHLRVTGQIIYNYIILTLAKGLTKPYYITFYHSSSSSTTTSITALPYLLSKKRNEGEVAAAAAAAAGARERVRFSIFRMDEVSGRGPVSFRGEFPIERPLLFSFGEF